MNKYLQFVFLLLFVSIISYSQQGLGYYIGYNEVPKEFKERYFSKGHPDFYPKHVGDMWQYVYYDYFYDTLRYYDIRIIGDTVVNNKRYFNRKYSSLSSSYYFRTKEGSQPEDYGVEYILDAEIPYGDMDGDGIFNEDLMVDSLSAPIGSEYTCYYNGSEDYHFVYDSLWFVTNNNDTLLAIQTDGLCYGSIYVDGLWRIEVHPEQSAIRYLTGAIINGVVYGTIVDVEEEGNELPVNYRLSQNYPNPFNPTTTIEYSIPNVGMLNATSSNVKLIVYDVLGRKVTTLVNEKQTPGNYSVKFDASNLPSGIYFYTLRAGDFVATKKMILMK